MLVHDFISISRDEIPKEVTYDLVNKHPCVHLSDEIIVNNKDFFTMFPTYWEDFSSTTYQGLNYHGITIIPNESLFDFILVIEKYNFRKDVQILLDFCRIALLNQKDIIHFGI